jgi:hypothetical protein
LASTHTFDGLGESQRSSHAASPSTNPQNRQSDRITVTGRAQLCQPQHAPLDARLHDMSMSGFSLFLDFQLRLAQVYHLKLSVFRHGRTFVLEVQALSVYALLVRADGFKHGFEFRSLDEAAEDAIRAILG